MAFSIDKKSSEDRTLGNIQIRPRTITPGTVVGFITETIMGPLPVLKPWYSLIDVSIHNPTNRILDTSHVAIALILPSKEVTLEKDQSFRYSLISESILMVHMHNFKDILPKAWESQQIKLIFLANPNIGAAITAAIRVISEKGSTDIPFSISLTRRDENNINRRQKRSEKHIKTD